MRTSRAMADLAVAWGALSNVVNPAAVAQARLHVVDLQGKRLQPPILDTEPWRLESFYDAAPFGLDIPTNPAVVSMAARIGVEHRAVEIGCGAGRNARTLLAATRNVVVLDQSRHSLERVVRSTALRAV